MNPCELMTDFMQTPLQFQFIYTLLIYVYNM